MCTGHAKNILKNLGVDFNITKASVKKELLEHFGTSAEQERYFLVFLCKSMHEMFQCAKP